MIRFVEVSGLPLNNQKCFGFYCTTQDVMISIDGEEYFDSIEDFEQRVRDDHNMNVDVPRLRGLIWGSWKTPH